MTSAFAMPDAPSSVSRSPGTAAPAGSQLHRTWEASLARAAYAERRRARRAAEREYRVVNAAVFPVFLVAAAGLRLAPGLRRRVCGEERRSVLGDARAMAAATLPIAFMA
jgi:hypothetical protein